MPPTIVLVRDEADVLRDEGEAMPRACERPASRSRPSATTTAPCTTSRCSTRSGSTHATRAAVAHAIAVLREALHNVRR
jgi:hypothetical protein